MNEHPQIQAQLTVYPTLDRHARQQVDQHLPTCPECTETLAAYTSMDQAVHRLVDDKLRYLATQPLQPAFMPGQRSRDQPIALTPLNGWRSHAPWLKTNLRQLIQPRLFALQLAGAGILILLLVALSMLLAWNPEQEHQIASTPTFEHPLATATPQLYGGWDIQVAHQQNATPFATVSVGATVQAAQVTAHLPAAIYNLLRLATAAMPLTEVDKTKMATLNTNQALLAARGVATTYVT